MKYAFGRRSNLQAKERDEIVDDYILKYFKHLAKTSRLRKSHGKNRISLEDIEELETKDISRFVKPLLGQNYAKKYETSFLSEARDMVMRSLVYSKIKAATSLYQIAMQQNQLLPPEQRITEEKKKAIHDNLMAAHDGIGYFANRSKNADDYHAMQGFVKELIRKYTGKQFL